jgi:multidrug efflux pump
VLLGTPLAVFGAFLGLLMRNFELNVFGQIGLVMLIGLAAKNAILIVEFAVELNRKEGKSYFDAAVEAARLRLRPIIMTSFAFVLGTVPLAIATGASANSRHSIGTGVIGGTLAATLIAIFFIPMFFWLLESASAKFFGGKEGQAAEAPGAHDPVPAAPAEGG